MTEYRIRKRAQECAASGEAFAHGDVVVSAVYEDPEEGFLRKDIHERRFADAEPPFSHWKTVFLVEEEDSRKLDFDVALQFLRDLLTKADPEREGLVYVLTLLLSRKRRVKLKDTQSLPDGELLSVVVPGDEDDDEIKIRAPRLSEEQADALQAELAELFDFGPVTSE